MKTAAGFGKWRPHEKGLRANIVSAILLLLAMGLFVSLASLVFVRFQPNVTEGTFVITVSSKTIKQARVMAGTAAHLGVPLIVVGLDLPLEYVAELTNIENVVYLTKSLLARPDFDPVSHQLAGFSHAASTLPETCLLFIDLASGLWDETKFSDYISPRRIRCGNRAIRYGSSRESPRLPFLLLPPKSAAPSAHAQLANWVKMNPKCIRREYDPLEPVPTSAECGKMALSAVEQIFWEEQPMQRALQPMPTYMNNRPACSTKHVLRTQPLRPFISDKIKLCIGIPTLLAPNIPWEEQQFFKYLVKSLKETMLPKNDKVARRMYILLENNDPVYSTPEGQAGFRKKAIAELGALGFEIIIVIIPYADKNAAYFWNTIFAGAYDDGCDYMYHLVDDVDLLVSPGVGYDWETKFISLLQNANPPNVGAIGGPHELNTMPFVHRTHYEIFGIFYTTHTNNIMCDTIHYFAYKDLNLLRGPDEMINTKNWSEEKSIGRRYKECEVPFRLDWDDYNLDMYKRFTKNRERVGSTTAA